MERIKRYLLGSTFLTIVVFILAFAFTDVRRAVADEFKDVRVINPVSQPVPVRDSSLPLRTRVQIQVNVLIDFGETFHEAEVYTVPAGRRLVIEHVAFQGENIEIGNAVQGTLISSFGGEIFVHPFDIRRQDSDGAVGPLFVANHPLLAFTDPGQVVRVSAEIDEPQGSGSGFFSALRGTLSGYLEEVSP